MNLQTVTTTDVQRNFKKILDDLSEPVVVVRDSKPEAVVVSYGDYQDFVVSRRKMMADRVRKALAPVHEQTRKISNKELEDLIKEALDAAGRN